MFKFQYQNGKKRKSWKRLSGLQNGAIRGLQIGVSFRDYRSGQEGVQIGAALRISSRGKKITNRGKPNGHIFVDSPSIQQSLFKLHRFSKTNPRGNYDIDSTWIFRLGFDFQNRQNIDEFSTWIFYVVSTSNQRNFCTCCFCSIIS